jgi:hypothetical protein
VACAAAVVAVSVYHERSVREHARLPVAADSETEARFLWLDSHDSVGLRDVQVVYVVPLTSDAPLPPGVAEWPAEGEVLLSPALREYGRREGIESRFGTTVGEIGPEGLASPNELFAYVNPGKDSLVRDALYPQARFGDPWSEPRLGEAGEVEPLALMLTAIVLLVMAPALLLTSVAARIGARSRQYQARVLTVLGASRGEIWRWSWGTVRRAMVVGGLVGALVVLVVCATGMWVPGAAYAIAGGDIRAGAFGLLVAVVLAWLLAAATATAVGVLVTRSESVRLAPPPARVSRRGAVACLAAGPLAVAAALAAATGGATWTFFTYFAAVVLIVATLPSLLGWLIGQASSELRARGVTRSDPAALIAGGVLEYDWRSAVRSGWALAALLVLVTQVNGYLMLQGESVREAREIASATGDRVATVISRETTTREWPKVVDAVDAAVDEAALVAVTTRQDDDSTIIEADRKTLESLGLAESIGSVVDVPAHSGSGGHLARTLANVLAGSVANVEATDQLSEVLGSRYTKQGSSADYATVLLVASRTGDDLDIAALHAVVAQTVAPTMRVLKPGESWLLGLTAARSNAMWVGWLAIAGTGILAAAILAAGADDLRRIVATGARLTTLAGRRTVLSEVVMYRVVVPLGSATIVGVLLALVLAAALFTAGGSPVPGGLLATSAGAVACVTLVTGVTIAGALWSARKSTTARTRAERSAR